MKFIFLCQGWGVASTMFGRISVCLLLLSFVISNRTQKWFLWFLVVTQAVFNVSTIILIYVQCGSQVSALWDPDMDAQCWSPLVQRNIGFFQSSINFIRIFHFPMLTFPGWNSFTDLALTVLPAIMLWRIKVKLAKKVAVIFLLSLSVVYVTCPWFQLRYIPITFSYSALVASIIKAYLIKELGARDDFTCWLHLSLTPKIANIEKGTSSHSSCGPPSRTTLSLYALLFLH